MANRLCSRGDPRRRRRRTLLGLSVIATQCVRRASRRSPARARSGSVTLAQAPGPHSTRAARRDGAGEAAGHLGCRASSSTEPYAACRRRNRERGLSVGDRPARGEAEGARPRRLAADGRDRRERARAADLQSAYALPRRRRASGRRWRSSTRSMTRSPKRTWRPTARPTGCRRARAPRGAFAGQPDRRRQLSTPAQT